ncbi:fimbrial protein [Photobacterium damselae]|uniref:fimbrial protein n=1 Tax=Photobacterium damselae TaxID=38293 RepID=UPI003906E75C
MSAKYIFINIFFLCYSLSSNAFMVKMNGELVENACEIAPDSINKDVVFQDISVKDINSGGSIYLKKKFSLRFINCDLSTFHTLKLKFFAIKESEMLGDKDYYVRVNGVNANKIGIGLLNSDFSPLKLEEYHNNNLGSAISGKEIIVDFFAFIKGTPDAILNNSIVPGSYDATATFEVFYE